MNRNRFLLVPGIALVAVGAMIAVVQHRPGPARKSSAPSLVATIEGTPAGARQQSTNAEEIFKRAFWRRPGPDDLIKNAARSEWVEDGGVTRWQWFLEVEPSEELRSHLLERNPFSLQATAAHELRTAAAPPEWFPQTATGLRFHQSSDGHMTLLVREDQNRIFATASGYGFAKGAPEKVRPLVKIESSGRLPLTSPPDPRTP